MGVSSAQELEFERAYIASQRERYLATDVMVKVQTDVGYAEKIGMIEKALAGTKDWILDVGANTCGESEYLAAKGYRVIANDINEVALEISAERCERYKRPAPKYVVGDAQNLTLEDQCVSFVLFNESLHHMPDPAKALQHASRVLKPGGKIFLYEPYAYNPYRRLHEVRDYLKGTVEKSFGVRELKRLLADAGFEVVQCVRHVHSASEWKMATMSPLHRLLRKTYVGVSKRMLWLFGNVVVIGQKSDAIKSASAKAR